MASAIGAGPGGGPAPAGEAASVTRPVYPGALALQVRRRHTRWRCRPHAIAVAIAVAVAVAHSRGRGGWHVPRRRILAGVQARISRIGTRAPVVAATRVLRLRAGQEEVGVVGRPAGHDAGRPGVPGGLGARKRTRHEVMPDGSGPRDTGRNPVQGTAGGARRRALARGIWVAHPDCGEQLRRPTHGEVVDEILARTGLGTHATVLERQQPVSSKLGIDVGIVSRDLVNDVRHVIRDYTA